MEKAVTWAVVRVVEEDVDGSVMTAALLGAALESTTFVALGMSPGAALATGAAIGGGLSVRKKLRKGKKP